MIVFAAHVERAALVTALTRACNVVEKRNTIPILANVLLTAGPTTLGLVVTDLDMRLVQSIPAELTDEGAVTVGAHVLLDAIKRADGFHVVLRLVEEKLVVECGRSRVSLPTLRAAADEGPKGQSGFPVRIAYANRGKGETGVATHVFALDAHQLRNDLERVATSISTEETRYYLNGVFAHNSGGTLKMVSTDGHRLTKIERPAPFGCAGMPDLIIPRKVVALLLRWIVKPKAKDAAYSIMVSVSDHHVVIDGPTWALTSKLIDGTFPDYTRVIPTANDKPVRVSSKDFGATIKRVASISSSGGARAAKLVFGHDKVTISTTDLENGVSVEEHPCAYTGDKIEIGFNAAYLQTFCDVLPGTLEMTMADPAAPTLMSSPDAPECVGVLMPMRV